MTRSRRWIFALVAGCVALGPTGAAAWVAVRVAPRVGAVAVGVAAGAVAGAAVASTAQPQTVVVTPPPAPPPAPPPTAVGSVTTVLPSGCVSSAAKYQCGSVWYQPYFGSNGVYYQVVPPP